MENQETTESSRDVRSGPFDRLDPTKRVRIYEQSQPNQIQQPVVCSPFLLYLSFSVCKEKYKNSNSKYRLKSRSAFAKTKYI